MEDWIKCSDRLPEADTKVLILTSSRHHHFGFMDSHKKWLVKFIDYIECNSVTHWMPLPAPPE